MIITFYDKDFNPLQDNASLNVGEWQLVRRAVDFDDFTATCEPFLERINPTFVIMKDDFGRYKYGAFAGIPELTDENKTNLQASDLKTIFNNDILIDSSVLSSTYYYIKDYFIALFEAIKTQVVKDSFNIELDVSSISNLSTSDLKPSSSLGVYSIWEDCLVPYLKYYDLYMSTHISVAQKKIVYKIGYAKDKVLPLRLWEFGIKNYGKYIVSVNECQCIVYNSTNNSKTYGDNYILLSDNSITVTSSRRNLYPIKRKIILKETDDSGQVIILRNQGNVEALKELVEARYQEAFTINTSGLKQYEEADFGIAFNVYTERGVFYKQLPLGQVIESSSNEKQLKVGYKPDDIVFYL